MRVAYGGVSDDDAVVRNPLHHRRVSLSHYTTAAAHHHPRRRCCSCSCCCAHTGSSGSDGGSSGGSGSASGASASMDGGSAVVPSGSSSSSSSSCTVDRVRESWALLGFIIYLPMAVWVAVAVLIQQQAQQTIYATIEGVDDVLVDYAPFVGVIVGAIIGSFAAAVVGLRRGAIVSDVIGLGIQVPAIWVLTSTVSFFVAYQFITAGWFGAQMVFATSYVARAVPMRLRSIIFIIMYFLFNTVFPAAAFALLQLTPPFWSVLVFNIIVIVIVACLRVVMREQSIAYTLGGDPRMSRCRRFCVGCKECCHVESRLAILAVVFLLLTVFTGYQLYIQLVFAQSSVPVDVQLIAALVIVVVALLTIITSVFVLRCVPERLIMLVMSCLVIVGFLMVIRWTGTLIVSVWVTGSVITVISEQVILGLAHSLLTKLVTTPMQSMWAGLIMSMQALTNGVAFAWVDHDPNVEYLPSEITMGLVGAALLIMIPVYRRLVPQLFSPWSGAQLPVQVDRVRALHEKLSDDSPSPHVPKLLSMAVAAPIASIGAPRGVGSPRGQSSVPGSALSQFRGSRTPSTFAVNLDPLSASASSGAPTVTFPSDTSTASNQTASRRQGSVASSYAAGLGTSHQRPLSSAAGTGVPLVPSTNFDDLD